MDLSTTMRHYIMLHRRTTMQIELNEQEITKLIQLVTVDMVAELRKQPPEVDFKASLADLAQKLHEARNADIKTMLKNN